jgi:hypothetical protein
MWEDVFGALMLFAPPFVGFVVALARWRWWLAPVGAAGVWVAASFAWIEALPPEDQIPEGASAGYILLFIALPGAFVAYGFGRLVDFILQALGVRQPRRSS